ncbi:unnamed protein product [Cylindrotheca closterium]|uniref:N-alpha-acetyltransferase 40 n=1 Tax=Cylindrotheca closterium TaxID=2856 RepID=A0AAD2CDB9_9STRA|nr:unnamed protein product [Cylindrotheca closterium]
MKSKDLKILRKKITKLNRIEYNPMSKFVEGDLKLKLAKADEGAESLTIAFVPSKSLEERRLKECLLLFEENMGDLYRKSSWGLNMDEKTKELQHENARFLLLLTNANELGGFVHFRFEYDDDETPSTGVLYLYEIQISAKFRSQGIGTKVMGLIERIAVDAELPRVMLTAFRQSRAAKFYKDLKYSIDETDPSNYNQVVDYQIFSRALQ